LTAAPEPEKKAERAFAGPQGLRVLVVEDEEILGEQLKSILSLDGHSVHLCSSGEEALDALEQEFDLVITDLGMPGIGGKEVANVAKARYPRMPVGLVTGWTGDFMSPGELGGQNIDFVVPKPYRIQSIREAVAKACAPPPPSSEPVLSR